MNLTPDELKARFEAWATKNGTYDLRPAKWRVITVAGKPYDGYVRPYLNDRTVHTFQGFCAALGAPWPHDTIGAAFYAGQLGEPWKAAPFDVLASGQEGNATALERLAGEQHPCWSCKEPVTLLQRLQADGSCPRCRAELDLELWPQPKEPT